MLLEKSRETAPEGMKSLSQIWNKAPLWMSLVVKVKPDAIKNNIAQEPGMLGPWIKVNWVIKQEMARVNINILGISEHLGLEGVNLTQVTIISTTVGKNPLEEME